MNKLLKKIALGEYTITLETGHVARQATAAVMVGCGGTKVLVTVVGRLEAKPGADFFGLIVNYQERMYAAGKIPGGFIKREGKPSDNETLVSRLIDRPIRPLFPEDFYNEVQIVCTVMSFDPEFQPDMLAMVGASAALSLSGLPFAGPLGAVRVGYADGIYQINPSKAKLKGSKLDLVLAATKDAVMMVESSADELSEEIMLGAISYGHEMMQSVIEGIASFASEFGKEKWPLIQAEKNTVLEMQLRDSLSDPIKQAYRITQKSERQAKLLALRQSLIDSFETESLTDLESVEKPNAALLNALFSDLEKKIIRSQILAGESRIDGRDRKTVRPIHIEAGVLPRTHGSVLFTRGETQAIVVVTLGTEQEAQSLDSIHGKDKVRCTLHYNFPPYSVGETGMMMGPKRREIGHGRLAQRATEKMLPDQSEFPYSVRIVSEITESNGSSSMASVCGASLALMDAGVCVKSPVAGIAMGLVKEGEQFAILTDILGDEDHLGDMDFKVAGTQQGITALQMDIKIGGITQEIMGEALQQAKQARLHILDIMNKAMPSSREAISPYAPKIFTMKIGSEKIKDVIGKGGATIRGLTEEYSVNIDIDDNGVLKIYSIDQASGDAARKHIERLTAEVEIGASYEGKVMRIVDFGAFVNVLPGKDGLVHISQIAHERIEKVNDWVKEGQIVKVKVIDIDRQGKIKLSMKALNEAERAQG